jgi:hypothetical protein
MEMYKETPSIAILNKQKCQFFSFTKLENRKAEQILSGALGTRGRWEDVGRV